MNDFIFHSPTKIYFGKNSITHLKEALQENGVKKILLVYGSKRIKSNGIYDSVIKTLNELNIPSFEVSGIRPNPQVEDVIKGVKKIKENNIDFIGPHGPI